MRDPDFWSREFPITSITRADIVSAGLARKFVKTITDEQIREIASKMEDYYCDGSYWTDLKKDAGEIFSHLILFFLGRHEAGNSCIYADSTREEKTD